MHSLLKKKTLNVIFFVQLNEMNKQHKPVGVELAAADSSCSVTAVVVLAAYSYLAVLVDLAVDQRIACSAALEHCSAVTAISMKKENIIYKSRFINYVL